MQNVSTLNDIKASVFSLSDNILNFNEQAQKTPKFLYNVDLVFINALA